MSNGKGQTKACSVSTLIKISIATELKFVVTVATGGRVNFFQLCKFFKKTTRFLAKFVLKYEIYSFIW